MEAEEHPSSKVATDSTKRIDDNPINYFGGCSLIPQTIKKCDKDRQVCNALNNKYNPKIDEFTLSRCGINLLIVIRFSH